VGVEWVSYNHASQCYGPGPDIPSLGEVTVRITVFMQIDHLLRETYPMTL